jgi:2-C-methyl-D-erythritol 4-phosphate cytidylyltransferase
MGNNPDPIWAIVPASGMGARMLGGLPKQYLAFQGKSIIAHCLDRLLSYPEIEGVVVVLRNEDPHWEKLGYTSEKPVLTTAGGIERHHSVYKGLLVLQDRCGSEVLALVHDAIRPLVTHVDLGNVVKAARAHEAGAILATPVSDTLKLQGDTMGIIKTVSRDRLWRAFTPQVFPLQMLLQALNVVIDGNLEITDDASAIELLGYLPMLVTGDPTNIKITNPSDLNLAELIWLNQRDQ